MAAKIFLSLSYGPMNFVQYTSFLHLSVNVSMAIPRYAGASHRTACIMNIKLQAVRIGGEYFYLLNHLI